jgi:hypothetical protein
VRTRGSKSRRKTSLQICQIQQNLLGNIEISPPEIQFSSPKIRLFSTTFQLSSMAFCFPQQLSAFFNSFLIFLDGFLLSEKYKKIYLRRQVYKRSLFELHLSRHSLPELCNSCYNVYISPTHSCGAPVFPSVCQT